MIPAYRDRIEQPHHTLVVVGDTQRSMGFWRLLGRRDGNDAERRAVLADIAARDAGCVVLAGDLVALGESRADWAYFDDVMAGIRARGLPTLPVMGNHDYFVSRRRALPHLHKRFPRLASATWYVEVRTARAGRHRLESWAARTRALGVAASVARRAGGETRRGP